jgi:hypothetical protein
MWTSRAFVFFSVFLFSGMLLSIYAGRRIARWQQTSRPDAVSSGTGAVDAAIFGLMALLLAFSFSGAASRFESRRALIGEEANTIGTAYLRLDLLPYEMQPRLREEFRQYVRSRLAIYRNIPDDEAVETALSKSTAIQDRIWKHAVAASAKAENPAVTTLVLSAINEMIDITTPRTMALRAHPPVVIFLMLAVTVIVSSLLAGYNMTVAGSLSLMHVALFVLLVGASVYVTLDYEYPRIGLIRLDAADEVLVETLKEMK